MSAQDLAGVGGLAFNPTPAGFGLGLAGAVFGGGRKHFTPISSYKDGQYYFDWQQGDGPQKVNTDRYQFQGDAGKYNLLPLLDRKSVDRTNGMNMYNSIMQQFGGDEAAKNIFSQNFNIGQQQQPQLYGSRQSPYVDFGILNQPRMQGSAIGPSSASSATNLFQDRLRPDRLSGYGLLGNFSKNQNIPFFTPNAPAPAPAPSPAPYDRMKFITQGL